MIITIVLGAILIKRKRRRPTQARSNGNTFNNTTDNYCPLLDISNVHFAFNCSSYRFPSDLHPSVPPPPTLLYLPSSLRRDLKRMKPDSLFSWNHVKTKYCTRFTKSCRCEINGTRNMAHPRFGTFFNIQLAPLLN